LWKEAKLIAVEDISTTKKRLKIEIPTDIIEKEFKESLDNLRQRAKIPGFRPGKAPESLIEKRFGDDIKADIRDRLVPKYYSQALKEAELVPVTFPKFESALDIKRNAPLFFALTVEVRPNISDLNYTGLKVEDIAVQVEDKELEDTLKGLQEERAMFEAVEREIKEDDVVIIDYVKLDPTGEKELSSAKDQVMNLGNNLAPKGILEEIVGKKKGDTVDITLPSFEGDEVKEGAEAGNRLRITIKEVKEKKLPAIDDEFAKDFGKEDLGTLKEKMKEGILRAKKERAASRQKEKLLDTLVGSYHFDLPESLLEKELETLVVNERHKNPPKGLTGGQATDTAPQKDDSGLIEELRPKAVDNVKAAILLDMIAEKENITVTEEEMKTRIAVLARHLQTTPEYVINLFVTKDGSLDNLKRTIRDEKVMDLVLSKAEIEKGAE
jgi:trigger factor